MINLFTIYLNFTVLVYLVVLLKSAISNMPSYSWYVMIKRGVYTELEQLTKKKRNTKKSYILNSYEHVTNRAGKFHQHKSQREITRRP